jgi:hypothetical protein
LFVRQRSLQDSGLEFEFASAIVGICTAGSTEMKEPLDTSAFNNWRQTMKLIVVALLLTTATSATAQVHTLENSPLRQAHIWLEWEKTHPMSNQIDNRSPEEKAKSAELAKHIACDISHDSSTNINTISNCRPIPH